MFFENNFFPFCKRIDLAKAYKLNIKSSPAKAGGNSKFSNIVAIHYDYILNTIELFKMKKGCQKNSFSDSLFILENILNIVNKNSSFCF
jgi:hypothetical protein